MTKNESENKEIINWLRQNWFIIIFIGSLIVAWTSVNIRVNAMEKALAEYPSEDYFDLKFKTIEKDLANLGELMNFHIREEQ